MSMGVGCNMLYMSLLCVYIYQVNYDIWVWCVVLFVVYGVYVLPVWCVFLNCIEGKLL